MNHPSDTLSAQEDVTATPPKMPSQADEATGASLRVQMDLPVAANELGRVRQMLEQQDWSALGYYLGWKHPRHRLLIGAWLQGGRVCGKKVSCRLILQA